MKKFRKRILSIVLSLCLIAALLPVNPAMAASTDPAVDITATTYTSVSEIPTTFSGIVFTYTNSSGKITVDAGLYNVPAFTTMNTAFRYDPDVVTMLASDDSVIKLNSSGTMVLPAFDGIEFSYPKIDPSLIKEDLGTTDVEMCSKFSPLQRTTLDLNIESGKLSGDILATFQVGTYAATDYYTNITDEGRFYSAPTNAIMPLYSMKFETVSGKTVKSDTFEVFSRAGINGFLAATGTTADVCHGVAFVGFPLPEETKRDVTFKVTAGTTNLVGADIIVTGTSTRGTVVSETATLAADDEGNSVATITLPDGTDYSMKIDSTKPVDGKYYQMATAHLSSGWVFDVSSESTSVNYAQVQEMTNSYTIKVKAVDPVGNPVSLENSTLSFGGSGLDYTFTSAEDGVSFVTALQGDRALAISNIEGYQSTGDATIKVTPDNDTPTTKADLSVANSASVNGSVEVVGTGDDQYVKFTLKLAEVNIVYPIAVPKVNGEAVTVAQAKAMTVTLTPDANSSAALKAQVGSGVTFSGDAIVVEDDGTGKAKSINANVSVPDGAYIMTIGGGDFDSVTVPVTVTTNYDTDPATYTVNVGGTATLGEDGTVTSVTGGVTGTNTTGGTDDAGNGTVDLTGTDSETTITEGGEEVTGGLLETDTITGGNYTPGVVTDPMYEIDVTPASDYKTFKVEVYLRNAIASSGSFGMYFDPTLFGTVDTTVVDLADGLEISGAMSNVGINVPEVVYNTEGDSYITFSWQVPKSTTENPTVPVDASSARQLIATIELPVQSAYWGLDELKGKLDNRSIYTMDYARTNNGAIIEAAATDDTGAVNALVHNELLSGIWRYADWAGIDGCQKLDASRATRGGFYQIYYTGTDGYDVPYDVTMKFNMPEFIELNRTDFWVTDPDTGEGIEDAKIYIYTQIPDESNTEEPIELETDSEGYAHTSQLEGTYYYVVEHGSHWNYPDGTPETNTDGHDYDSYELTANGASPLLNVYPEDTGDTTTPVVNDCINPRMAAMTYHDVSLTITNASGTASSDFSAKITGSKSAYNGVDYFFNIEPDAGSTWDYQGKTEDQFMAEVAAKIQAKRYEIDATATTVADAFRKGEGTAVTVTWDADRDRFKISYEFVTGAGIGIDKLSNGTKVDPLRAGDITLELTEVDVLTTASYTITAIAGEGGEVSYAADSTVTTGTSTPDETAAPDKITEVLSDKRTTSGWFSFAPDAGHVIDSVTINGVDYPLTDAQKKNVSATNPFKYQFTNVSADQTIYVSFAKDNGEGEPTDPVSKAFLNVVVGDNGSAELKDGDNNPLSPASVAGPGSASYVVDGGKVVVTAVPADPAVYEVDSIVVDGVAQPANTTSYTFDNLQNGDTHSIAITFKQIGKDSTQAIVTAYVADGFGVLAPVGVSIHTIGDTPSYTMTPDKGWRIDNTANSGAILVNGRDYSADAVLGAGSYTYKLPALTGDTTLAVTFTENPHEVHGQIAISMSANDLGVAPATIIFVRAADEKNDEETVTLTSDKIPTPGTSSKILSFQGDVPAGTWTVTVKKQGYLDYEITNFVIDEDATEIIYFGDPDSKGGTVAGSASKMVPVPLTLGDAAGEGRAVAYNDAAVVVAGWLNGASPANKLRGDVNENLYDITNGTSSGSDSSDMAAVQNAMFKLRSSIIYYVDPSDSAYDATYTYFCPASASTVAE